MQKDKNAFSRKKFALWGLGVLASLVISRLVWHSNKKKETVKMLTQDGMLVEIEKDKLPPSKRKVSDRELKNWIKKK